MCLEAITRVRKCDSQTFEFFSAIYGSENRIDIKKVSNVLESIKKMMGQDFRFLRKKVFFSKAGTKEEETLSSANPTDKKVIISLYDAFFKKIAGDEKALNDRSSVILHELAHLTGLKSDAETQALDSAECLRNFILLVCEIVKPEDLFIGDEYESDDNGHEDDEIGEDGDLPHNPNHHPAGSPQGGQFAPKECGSGDGPSDDKNPKEDKEQKDKSDDKPESKSELKQPESDKSDKGPKIPKTPEEVAQNRKEIDDILDKAPESDMEFGWNEDSFSTEDKSESSDEQLMKEDYDPDKDVENRHHIWGTTDVEIKGLEPNSDYTVWMQGKYTYTDPETGESKTETAEWAYNAKTNEKGEINIGRVGIVNQDQANSVQNYKGGDMDIEFKAAPIKGTVDENFGKPDKVDWVPHSTTEMKENKHINDKNNPAYEKQGEYGMGAYGAAHANQHSGGGGINGRVPANKPEGVNGVGFKINGKDKSISTSKPMKNTQTSVKGKKSGAPLKRN